MILGYTNIELTAVSTVYGGNFEKQKSCGSSSRMQVAQKDLRVVVLLFVIAYGP